MIEEYKPKYKVGDRLIHNSDPMFTMVIKRIDDEGKRYIVDYKKDGDGFLYNSKLTFSAVELNFNLDLNHYIKSL